MTHAIEAKLLASIQELTERDYRYPISGYRIELYLDPEAHRVYTFDFVGAGVPMAAWHHRHRWICSIPDRAIPESVAEVVAMHVGHLVALCEQYLGDGRWAESEDHDPAFDFACYWDPGVWFEDSTEEILGLAARGYSPADILPTLYLGDQYNGKVEEEAALDYVTELVAEHHHEGPLS